MSDSITYTEAAPYRIMGMGMGTAAIFISIIFWVIIYLVTSPLDNCIKWFWRFWTTVSFGIVFVLLIYAEREPRYIYTERDQLVKVTASTTHAIPFFRPKPNSLQ